MGRINRLVREMLEVAHLCFQRGLVSGTSGNLSVRKGETMWISVTGACLGNLSESEIVSIPLQQVQNIPPDTLQAKPSSEYPFHRYLYEHSSFQAILHLHPPYCIALSFYLSEFIPETSERYFFPERIQVIPQSAPNISDYPRVARALTGERIVILKHHGIVSVGEDLHEAFYRADALEHAAHIAFLKRSWAQFL
ncbi:MAG: class II aldolase/adducin family protein [bacterium JZ-2024 1]